MLSMRETREEKKEQLTRIGLRFPKLYPPNEGSLAGCEAPERFGPRTHRLRGWIIDFPTQVPRRLLEYPELTRITECFLPSRTFSVQTQSLRTLLGLGHRALSGRCWCTAAAQNMQHDHRAVNEWFKQCYPY